MFTMSWKLVCPNKAACDRARELATPGVIVEVVMARVTLREGLRRAAEEELVHQPTSLTGYFMKRQAVLYRYFDALVDALGDGEPWRVYREAERLSLPVFMRIISQGNVVFRDDLRVMWNQSFNVRPTPTDEKLVWERFRSYLQSGRSGTKRKKRAV